MFLNSNIGLFSRKVAKLLVYAAKKIPQYTKLVRTVYRSNSEIFWQIYGNYKNVKR